MLHYKDNNNEFYSLQTSVPNVVNQLEICKLIWPLTNSNNLNNDNNNNNEIDSYTILNNNNKPIFNSPICKLLYDINQYVIEEEQKNFYTTLYFNIWDVYQKTQQEKFNISETLYSAKLSLPLTVDNINSNITFLKSKLNQSHLLINSLSGKLNTVVDNSYLFDDKPLHKILYNPATETKENKILKKTYPNLISHEKLFRTTLLFNHDQFTFSFHPIRDILFYRGLNLFSTTPEIDRYDQFNLTIDGNINNKYVSTLSPGQMPIFDDIYYNYREILDYLRVKGGGTEEEKEIKKEKYRNQIRHTKRDVFLPNNVYPTHIYISSNSSNLFCCPISSSSIVDKENKEAIEQKFLFKTIIQENVNSNLEYDSGNINAMLARCLQYYYSEVNIDPDARIEINKYKATKPNEKEMTQVQQTEYKLGLDRIREVYKNKTIAKKDVKDFSDSTDTFKEKQENQIQLNPDHNMVLYYGDSANQSDIVKRLIFTEIYYMKRMHAILHRNKDKTFIIYSDCENRTIDPEKQQVMLDIAWSRSYFNRMKKLTSQKKPITKTYSTVFNKDTYVNAYNSIQNWSSKRRKENLKRQIQKELPELAKHMKNSDEEKDPNIVYDPLRDVPLPITSNTYTTSLALLLNRVITGSLMAISTEAYLVIVQYIIKNISSNEIRLDSLSSDETRELVCTYLEYALNEAIEYKFQSFTDISTNNMSRTEACTPEENTIINRVVSYRYTKHSPWNETNDINNVKTILNITDNNNNDDKKDNLYTKIKEHSFNNNNGNSYFKIKTISSNNYNSYFALIQAPYITLLIRTIITNILTNMNKANAETHIKFCTSEVHYSSL